MIQLPFNRIALIEGVRAEIGDTLISCFRPKHGSKVPCPRPHALGSLAKNKQTTCKFMMIPRATLLEIGLNSATAQTAV